MRGFWPVRILILLLALGLAGNSYGNGMLAASSLPEVSQPAVAAEQQPAADVAMTANCCAENPKCATNFMAVSACCTVGAALSPDTDLAVGEPPAGDCNTQGIARVVAPQKPAPLFRPPRA